MNKYREHRQRRSVGPTSSAHVSDLSAALGVKRRTVEHDLAFLAFVQRIDFIAFDNRDNLRIIDSRRFVALEYRFCQRPASFA